MLAIGICKIETQRNSAWGSWTSDNVNASDPVDRWGFNTAFSWEREKLAGVSLGYSFVNAEFDGGQYDGNAVPHVPESTVTLTGRVWLWDDCFVFGGYRYQSKMYSISDFNNDGSGHGRRATIPSYGVFHVGVTYEPTFAAWITGWKASFVCDNLFNENYCTYASCGANYWPADGRSFMFTLRYDF